MQRLLLALLAAAAAGAVTALPGNRGRALRQVPTRYKFWAGCAAPAYCQPADGPNLVDPAAAAAASADDSKVTASAAAPGLSPYWGAAGELWTPAGKLMDWSFAGYRQGNEPLPTPNVTISYKAFQRPSMSDTQALLAAVAWAHKQPYDREWYGVGIGWAGSRMPLLGQCLWSCTHWVPACLPPLPLSWCCWPPSNPSSLPLPQGGA